MTKPWQQNKHPYRDICPNLTFPLFTATQSLIHAVETNSRGEQKAAWLLSLYRHATLATMISRLSLLSWLKDDSTDIPKIAVIANGKVITSVTVIESIAGVDAIAAIANASAVADSAYIAVSA